MTSETTDFGLPSDSVEDCFDLGRVVASTLTAQAFSAVDLRSQQNVTVWKTRGPLAGSEIERFKKRLAKMRGVPHVQPILSSGVDSSQRGFAVLPAYDGRPIDCPAKTPKDLEKRFNACVALVESLHKKKIACGDLCLDSFVVSDRGAVTLFAVLGDVRLDREEMEFNKARYLGFRPPEQKLGGIQDPSVDSYALSVIEEGLFAAAQYPEEKVEEKAEKRAEENAEEKTEEKAEDKTESKIVPAWLKKMLKGNSSEDQQKKMRSAATARLNIDDLQDDSAESTGDGALDDSSGQERKVSKAVSKRLEREDLDEKPTATKKAVRLKEIEGGDEGVERERYRFELRQSSADGEALGGVFRGLPRAIPMPNRVMVLLFLNFIALGGLLLSFSDLRSSWVREKEKQVQLQEVGPVEREGLVDWYESNDSAAHATLCKELEGATSPLQRTEIFHTLTSRARRLGLGRSAEVAVRFYGRNDAPAGVDEATNRTMVSQVLNPSLSPDERLELLARLYDVDPQSASLLAASFALDVGNGEPFRGILARAVSAQVGIPNGGEHSPFALILLLPNAHDLFSEDIVEISDKIPSSDISWLLEELGRNGQPEVATVAQLAVKRGIVTGARGVFLKELQHGAALSQQLRSSLVSGALDRLSETDIKRFGQWYGQGAPRVLEAGILTTTNPEIKASAFEALATKAIPDPYVSKVMDFIRTTYEADGGKYGGLVAVVALRDVVDTATIDQELEKINGAPHMKELLQRLVKGAPPEILEAMLNRYSSSMDPLDIVDLLENPSPRVRIAAISHLGQVNDIMLLKLISQSYDDEKDSQVREVYEQKISGIRRQ